MEKLKQDVNWTISDVNYVVRNVPYTELDAEGDEFFDLGVTIKLAMIRDLMYMNQIPHDVNFDDVADMKF